LLCDETTTTMTEPDNRQSAGGDRSAECVDHRREQAETLDHDPAVEQGAQSGLAPYARYEGPNRVDGVYIVRLRKGADPTAMIAGMGIGTRNIWPRLPGFCAELTDAELDRVRRDPDVEFVEDNVRGRSL
jgi:hypothetical protein